MAAMTVATARPTGESAMLAGTTCSWEVISMSSVIMIHPQCSSVSAVLARVPVQVKCTSSR